MGGRWIHNTTVKLPGVKVGVSRHLFRSVLQPSSNKSPNGSSSPACTSTKIFCNTHCVMPIIQYHVMKLGGAFSAVPHPKKNRLQNQFLNRLDNRL